MYKYKNKTVKRMKKVLFTLLIVLLAIPAKAQFDLKGGISLEKNEIKNFVVTGQFHKDLLALSGDLLIPTQKNEKLAGGGRIGLNIGNNRFFLIGDVGGKYQYETWNLGCGVEGNIKLFGPVGVFGRWSRYFPIYKQCDRTKIHWDKGYSELSFGIAIDLVSGGCY